LGHDRGALFVTVSVSGGGALFGALIESESQSAPKLCSFSAERDQLANMDNNNAIM
jgi:hypothetical protein